MRVPDYMDALKGPRRLAVVQNDELDEDHFELVAPDPNDPDMGPDMGRAVGAAEAVELMRALTAWLRVHRSIHPQWHRDYAEADPGGWR